MIKIKNRAFLPRENVGMWTKKQQIRFWRLPLLLLALGCKKDDAAPAEILEDGKSTVVYDLPGDTNGSMAEYVPGKTKQGFDVFLFRFRDKKQIWLRNEADSARWLKTAEWDIAFTGPYNSEVFVNNANYKYNPGYGGQAENTAVVMIDGPYARVDEAPTDEEFDRSEVNKIGWASSPSSNGWFFYDMGTHISVPIKARAYAIRLPDGKYAKLQLVSPYQGNPPEVTNMHWPAPYFTFRYYVQQDGGRDLKTSFN